MSNGFVIVGAGLAAGTAVTELRSTGFDGRIVVYGDERHPPYERPPLSKAYLLGNDPFESALVHPEQWYAEHDVELRLGHRVSSIDPDDHSVTADGKAQRYDRLLLATGASPRRFALADASGAPVAYLRTVEDSSRLKATFGEGQKVVIIGGGWIGLEVASAARMAGSEVTVVESLELPLLRVLGPEVAAVFADLHREHGVDLRTGSSVTAVHQADGRSVVQLDDGDSLDADLIVVGIGVVPNDELARQAGLATDNGILVDERLATSAPDVFAAGDVANAQHPVLGRRIRVEHWDTAIEQGKVVAHNLLGEGVPYTRQPYFYTDQYDLGMEYVGSVGPDGADEVVLRGDVPGRVFTAFWLKDGVIAAGMHVNDWDAIDPVRSLVGQHVDRATLENTATDLSEIAATATG